MELDFSKLNSAISAQEAENAGSDGGGTTPHIKTEIGEKAQVRINRAQEDYRQTAEIYKEYQRNIKASEELQAEIMKGLQSGEPVETLLLKAIQAIAAMTNNKVFADQAQRYIDEKAEG